METTAHGPNQTGGRAAYIAEYIYPDGSAETEKAMTGWMHKTEVELTLTAIIHALHLIGPGQNVNIFTPCARIPAALRQGWLLRWKTNDWRNAKGEKVVGWVLWARFDELIQGREIEADTVSNTYRNWLRSELKRQNDRCGK